MRKLLTSLPSAFVVALVVAAIASAAPTPRSAVEEPTPTETPVPEVSPDPETEPIETEPVETEPAPVDEEVPAEEGGNAPDFTQCAGETGLDNAICRHDQLLLVHPNQGLENSRGHLVDNKAEHEGETQTEGDAEEDEVEVGGTDTSSTQPGHGNGHGNAGGNGNGNG
jgi:outer membrane biosynthesis protein TonB